MNKILCCPGIYTIPAGARFLPSLAYGMYEGYDNCPHLLSNINIFLPTKRSCRVLRESFLEISDGKSLVLPRMQTFGDHDTDELDISIDTLPENSFAESLEKEPIASTKRQILLSQIIQKLPNYEARPDQALKLAKYLGVFIDQIYTEGLDMSGLKDIVPEEFSEHWQVTLDFLTILSDYWPQILEENNLIDIAAHRIKLISSLSDYWKVKPPVNPIIAAGSTGSIPATAELLKTILSLPNGYVVLPGLDKDIDQESWDGMEDSHPQARMKKLLTTLNIDRNDVKLWPEYASNAQNEETQAKEFIASEIMRPARTSSKWGSLKNTIDPDLLISTKNALNNLSIIECETVREEANIISIAIREALESPDKTVIVITPDRAIARRIAVSCKRWGINIDDSGGKPLSETPLGIFFRLAIHCCNEQFSPTSLCSLLKNQLFNYANQNSNLSKTIYELEKLILRGPTPKPGLSSLLDKTKEISEHHRDTVDEIVNLLSSLSDIAKPLSSICAKESSFENYLNAHILFVENLFNFSELTNNNKQHNVWELNHAEDLACLISELREHSKTLPQMSSIHYERILTHFMSSVTVRPKFGVHSNLSILGLLEARLMHADLIIMAGLNEGTWPKDLQYDPWLSRKMRHELKLPSLENSVGLSAHDFVQAFCANKVIITRSRRVNNSPAVPSRWLQKLDTVLEAMEINPGNVKSDYYKFLLKQMDSKPEPPTPCTRAQFSPPLKNRPKELSVTQIETLMHDPYSIYAYKVLRLKKLKPLDEQADASIRGTIIHDTLELFINKNKKTLSEDSFDQLKAICRDIIDQNHSHSANLEFWWPRFVSALMWFSTHERIWRNHYTPLYTEETGSIILKINEVDFTLKAKADRIDHAKDGSLAVIDYKTGQVPTSPDIVNGFKPQMPLEGLIALKGGFSKSETKKEVEYLGFWVISGGADPGKERPISIKNLTIKELIEQSEKGLVHLLETFLDSSQPYISLPRIDKAPPKEWRDYDHLARVSEWADIEEEGIEAA